MKSNIIFSNITKVFKGLRFFKRTSSPSADEGFPTKNLLSTPNTLLVSQQNGVRTLVLNRPEVLNAIDMNMAEVLLQHLEASAIDPSVRAIIITGAGRAFCAGGDLKFAVQANPEQPGDSFLALTTVLHDSIEVIRTMAKPVVAAINGPAAGAGLFLALACDMRVMAHSAYLKQSNTSYGLSLPAGGTFSLPRLIGMGRALEMILLDRLISAQEAQRVGLVSTVVKARKLYAVAQDLTFQASQMPIHTLGRVKQLMNESFDRSLVEQLAAEQQAIVKSANSPEGREGLSAFVEKRKPAFTNISARMIERKENN